MSVNRCCVLTGHEKVEILERPVPEINDDQVLVEVVCTGICGSDLHLYHNPKAPKIALGHEGAGRVAKVGGNVTTRRVGQRVAIEPGFKCRRCEFCQRGQSNVCANMRFGGGDIDGTMSMWFACEPDMAVPFPDTISWEEAGCIQPLAIAVQLARQVGLGPHQTVAVFGCGPLGLMVMAVAKAYNVSKIVAFDIDASRVDFAIKYAADHGVVTKPFDLSGGKDPYQAVKELTVSLVTKYGLQPGVDIAIDATGAESCLQMAVALTKPHGTVCAAGLGKQLSQFPIWDVTVKSLTVKETIRYSHECFQNAIDLLARGQLDVKSLITRKFPLTKIQDALESQLKKEGIKIVIMCQE